LNRTTRLALLLLLFVFALACRTTELVAQSRPTSTNTRPRPTRTETRKPRASRTQVVVEAQVIPVTNTPAPNAAAPTDKPRATNAPNTPVPKNPTKPPATARPTNTQPAPTPTSQFLYQVTESRCGPNVRTYIEGTITENNTPKNDLLVRISQGPDGQPDPNDDFRTGSDPRKGYYFHNINVGAPHGGTWYIWVIDPATQQRISAIAIVKTDSERVEDSGTSAGSCQSATVNFSNKAPSPAPRTPTPSRTLDPNAGPTPTKTQDPGNDS